VFPQGLHCAEHVSCLHEQTETEFISSSAHKAEIHSLVHIVDILFNRTGNFRRLAPETNAEPYVRTYHKRQVSDRIELGQYRHLQVRQFQLLRTGY